MPTAERLIDYCCHDDGAGRCRTMHDFVRYHAGYQFLHTCNKLGEKAGPELLAGWEGYSRWFVAGMTERTRRESHAYFDDRQAETFLSMFHHAHRAIGLVVKAIAETWPRATLRASLDEAEAAIDTLLGEWADERGWRLLVLNEDGGY